MKPKTPFDRRLRAAAGFLELGPPLEVRAELEQIEVLIVRVGIYRGLAKWERLGEVSSDIPATFSGAMLAF